MQSRVIPFKFFSFFREDFATFIIEYDFETFDTVLYKIFL